MKIEGFSTAVNNNYSTDVSPVQAQTKEDAEIPQVQPAEEKAETKNGWKFPGEKQMIDAIEKSNKDLVTGNTSLKFSIHQKTKQIVVKVINNDTHEIVKEIPPEKILDMVAAMMEKAGIFIDKKA